MNSTPESPLTIQKVRDLIAEKHNVLLDENDPILLAVTMHRAFLDEYESMLTTHAEFMEADMQNKLSSFATEVRKSTNVLLSKAVKANIENCMAEISEHKKSMTEFLSSIKSWAIVAGVMLTLSIATSLSVIVWGS